MQFRELDNAMRIYETNHDQYFLPEMELVVRLDGRGFTGLTERMGLVKPYDDDFRTWMVDVTQSLMEEAGVNVAYGYTQSDEISLLLRYKEDNFNRLERKLLTILAGHASAVMSQILHHRAQGEIPVFDARVIQLPNWDRVVDYFRWRQADAARNSLNSWCYWMLRNGGLKPRVVAKRLDGLSVAQKNDLLFDYGINYDRIPAWQKRGVGLLWENYEKVGFNPITGLQVRAERRRVVPELDLPYGDEYMYYLDKVV